MKRGIKSFLFVGLIAGLLLGLSGALNGLIGSFVLKKGQETLLKLPKGAVDFSYDSLQQNFCLFKVCLKAQNVQIQIKQLGLNVCLGDVLVQKGVVGDYEISSQALSSQQNSSCIGLSGQLKGNRRFWSVSDVLVFQKGFKASFSGVIDIPSQMISIDGKTEGLADFVVQFIPSDFQFMGQLLFSNKEQSVSVRSDETHVKIFGLPLFKKSYIFNNLAKGLPF